MLVWCLFSCLGGHLAAHLGPSCARTLYPCAAAPAQSLTTPAGVHLPLVLGMWATPLATPVRSLLCPHPVGMRGGPYS